MPDENVVQAATGESLTGLAAMLGGALVGPWAADVTLGRFSPFGTNANTLILGGTVAYFGSGHVRKAGQGAAIIGAVGLLRESFPALQPSAAGKDQGWVTV